LFSPIALFIHPQKWSKRATRRLVTRQNLERAGAMMRIVAQRRGAYSRPSCAYAAAWRATLAAVTVPGSLKQVSRKSSRPELVAAGPSHLRAREEARQRERAQEARAKRESATHKCVSEA
jgi:hypothetical protein